MARHALLIPEYVHVHVLYGECFRIGNVTGNMLVDEAGLKRRDMKCIMEISGWCVYKTEQPLISEMKQKQAACTATHTCIDR